MSVISMKQLLEAGVHFGHQTRRWNPKMGKYIFQERNGIHIINLESSSNCIDRAYEVVKEISAAGKSILFVGTKKQAQEAIKEEALRCGMYYINNRWLGGTLTNFRTIRTRIDRLNKIDQMERTGELSLLTKKESIKLLAERDKLEANLGGIREMKSLPGLVVIVDTDKEHICVDETKKLHIPTIGLVDTNCNPEDVTYCIPGNDDAIRSVKLIVGALADAVIEGREGVQMEATEEVKVEEAVAQNNEINE